MNRIESDQPRKSTAFLSCGTIVLLIVLTGCGSLSTRYHDHQGDCACLKVCPFWENDDGERYLVGGLDCRLYPRGGSGSDSKLIETTDTERPLYFDGLLPGEYRLKIYLDDQLLLSELLDLVARKRLTVKIDVKGARRANRFRQTLDRIGTGIGSALVDVGQILVLIFIDGLEMSLEDAIEGDDDEQDNQNAFDDGGEKKKKKKGRDKKPVPRKGKPNAFGRPPEK